MASNNTIFPAGNFPSGDGNTSNKLLENPNQYSGSKAGLEAKAVEGGMYVRIDMPGVEKEDVEVWMEDKTVFFIGEAKKQWEHEPSGRIYGGNIDLSSDSGEVTEVKTDVQNGVLRMILVGCRIKPDLSAITKPSSLTKKSDKAEYEFMIVGDYMLKNRLFNLFTPPEKYQGYYPFQVGGPGGAYEAKIINQEQMYLRMDMPDVSKEDTVVQFRDNLVLYGGTGFNGSVHDGEKRKYFGKFELKCSCCAYVNVKSEMKAGVLRMLISKRKI